MKVILSLIAIFSLSWLGWKFIQSPESYLKKQTQKLIAMAVMETPASDIDRLSHISKMAKFIHVNIHLSAMYENQILTAKSLNEFRSLLFAYFKRNVVSELSHKELTINLKEDNTQATATFDIIFKREKINTFCKVLLEWVKEKKWYVKKIKVFSCVES